MTSHPEPTLSAPPSRPGPGPAAPPVGSDERSKLQRAVAQVLGPEEADGLCSRLQRDLLHSLDAFDACIHSLADAADDELLRTRLQQALLQLDRAARSVRDALADTPADQPARPAQVVQRGDWTRSSSVTA